MRMMFRKYFQKAGLIFISILLSLFIGEIVLHFVIPENDKLYVWQPNLQHTFYPDPTVFYGIKDASQFSINSEGFRGENFSNDARLKFLCLGGSTTECLYLDNTECLSFQLQQKLNSDLKKWNPQIGSVGKSGCTTREHYIQLKYFVPQLGKIDGIVVMVGLNDMFRRLSRDTLFENDFRFTQQVEDSFVSGILLSSKKENSWLRNLRLFKLVRQFLHSAKGVEWENIQDDKGEVLRQWRENRNHASRFFDSLPDLNSALNEFERNLQLIYDETQKQQMKLILVNQAVLYKDSMSDYENDLMWMGGIGNFQQQENCVYYSPRALNAALSLYNERMKNFCSENPFVTLVDLASQLPKDTSVFYDDCHFNENGAIKAAEIIANRMLN